MTQISTSIPTDDIPQLPKAEVEDHHHHHPHPHHHHGDHSHTHGVIDPEIASSARGIWAVKWSLVGLVITAILQAVVFWLSGSVALLADLIHNVGDAMTAVPLGVAFLVSRRKPTARFSYGFARLEDLAGVMIVVIVLLSAVITAYESVERFYHPQPLHHLGALAIAAIVGFIGNEVVALFRIRVGREINSAALIADGYHAMADGLVSLAVLVSAVGVALGYSWADPVIGLVITAVLLKIVWESGQTIFSRLLDGVEPEVLESLNHAINHVPEVEADAVANLRPRWLGHRLHVEMDIMLPPTLSLQDTQRITNTVEEQLKAELPYLGLIVVRAVPFTQTRESGIGNRESGVGNRQ
ncbi:MULTISPECIES: cation diffusion facilitator family transporter [Moorena]|uniref:Cation diffusion facilitator family transporter n=2 Tax=Moorena TaxID=1155738 RepID=F4XN86_9CYAN|nr:MULTISPECIES: cation diffusion facilitator family transporter [Moorena]EGJ34145.1 cation diffusion facilitator family transporter [Moorena producens 3L]NEP69548.1 cation transporter [Moorena sp. SIO3A5]NER85527.1 cation transporter [Moorena sp. SIO3A2]OLT65106.1 cation-efflux pump [Moorena producens 3L]